MGRTPDFSFDQLFLIRSGIIAGISRKSQHNTDRMLKITMTAFASAIPKSGFFQFPDQIADFLWYGQWC